VEAMERNEAALEAVKQSIDNLPLLAFEKVR
jgi:hypothetical protein